MFRTPSYRIRDTEPESILVYGNGETPIAYLAVGLAQRFQPEFAWANCAPPNPRVERKVRELMVRHAYDGRDDTVPLGEMERHVIRVEAFNALVATTIYRNLLLELLRLPALMQGVVPYPPEDGDHPTLVLAGVDALPGQIVRDTLEDFHLHETLHRARLTLVATYRGAPPPELQRRFDRIFGVEEVAGATWTEALVWSERGQLDVDLLHPQTMREAWRLLGLDGELLDR